MKKIAVITSFYYPEMSPLSAVFDKYIQRMKGEYQFFILAPISTVSNYPPLDDPYVKVLYLENKIVRWRIICEEKYKKDGGLVWGAFIRLFKIRTAILACIGIKRISKWMEKASYKKLNNLYQSENIDAIISINGLDLYYHLGAKRFKTRYPNVKWITMVMDPLTYSSSIYLPLAIRWTINFHIRKLYQHEQSIYQSSDYNIFMENLYDDALANFHLDKNKMYRFRFVLDDIRKIHNVEHRQSHLNAIRLIYAGALYRELRNPEYMLSVVSRIEGIHLDVYTRHLQCWDILEKYISDKISVFPAANTLRYQEMICNEYDILLNIGNNCTNQLPSKTLELLSTGKPIVNFYIFKDVQYEMIEKYPLGINIGKDDEDAVQKLEKFCYSMKGRQMPFNEVEALFPENSLKHQQDILESILS